MKENRRKSLVSGVALTCGAILLGSMNAQVAHADADTGAGGSTAPTTEVSKSNSEKAETSATSAEPQAASDANTENGTTPDPGDKAKSDNDAGDKTKTDDKSKTNDPADNQKEPTVETIDGIVQETVTGEDPVLGANILTSDEWKKHDVNPDNLTGYLDSDNKLPAFSLTWKKAPDVSKSGKSEGTAIVTSYELDPSSKSGVKAVKTFEVKIDVDVKDGIKKTDNQVRNRLTYIDKDSNEVVASYSWLSKNAEPKKDNQVDSQADNQQAEAPKTENDNQAFTDYFATDVDQTVIGLGYQVLQDDSDAIHSLQTFGKTDQVVNVFVKKDSPDHKLMTWGEAAKEWDASQKKLDENARKAFQLPSYLSLSNDSYNNIDINDPTNLIADVNDLPAGARVTWVIAPHYTDLTVDNDPTIVISVPGQKNIILHLSDYDGSDSKDKSVSAEQGNNESTSGSIDKLLLRKHAYGYVPTWGPAVVSKGKPVNPVDLLADKEGLAKALLEANNPSALFMTLASESDDSNHEPTQEELVEYISNPARWTWDVEPDLSKPGYTIAFARFTPLANDDHALIALTAGIEGLCGASGVRLHVVPKAETNPDDKPTKPDDHKPTDNTPTDNTPTDDQPTITTPTQDLPYTPSQDDHEVEVHHDEQKPAKRAKVQVKTRQNAVRVTRAASPIKTAKQARASLPQTGDVANVVTAILAILTLGLSLVLLKKPKRQN